MLAVPLLLIEIGGGRGMMMGGPELHRQVVEAHWEVVARNGIVASPPVLERRRAAPVIQLLEAVVESNAHAAVDAEVVVRFIGAIPGGQSSGIGRRLLTRPKLRVHHGKIKAEMIAVALRVSVEAISISGKAVVGLEMAVHGGGGARRSGQAANSLPKQIVDWIGSD